MPQKLVKFSEKKLNLRKLSRYTGLPYIWGEKKNAKGTMKNTKSAYYKQENETQRVFAAAKLFGRQFEQKNGNF